MDVSGASIEANSSATTGRVCCRFRIIATDLDVVSARRCRRITCLTGRVRVILYISTPFDPPPDHDPGGVGRVEAVRITASPFQHTEDRGRVGTQQPRTPG